MKKTLILILILINIFLLFSCDNSDDHIVNNNYTVSYYNESGELIKTLEIPKENIFDFEPENYTVDGKTFEFHKWDYEIDDKLLEAKLKASFVQVLPKTNVTLTNEEVFNKGFRVNDINGVLVVLVNFKDSYEVDKEKFENCFTKDYELGDSLRSVKSYYKYNSYGKDLLDFSFVYYNSNMTSEEAWHYVNDEDKNGMFVGNTFFFDIFDELRKNGEIDTKSLDKNGDGYVDGAIFIFNDNPISDGRYIYGSSSGISNYYKKGDVDNPVLRNYIKSEYNILAKELTRGLGYSENTRELIHEMGHLFGLYDYYDFYPYEGTTIDSLGAFDMQSTNTSDWNSFSKLTCGWISPYVIDFDDTVTIKLRASGMYSDAVLIPTSKGWNNTPYDEYILIDLLAPVGATGFDWTVPLSNTDRTFGYVNNSKGGIRILHVDARIRESYNGNYKIIKDVNSIDYSKVKDPGYLQYNTNGLSPMVDGQDRFEHLVDLIPSDGSNSFRISTATNWSAFRYFTTNDLFGEGDSFTFETHSESFPHSDRMNNGGTLDYKITVLEYDKNTYEAVIKIEKIK